MLKMIVAMDRNQLIGKGNSLPWSLPNDLSYFRKMTTQHTVVMGRKTFESLPGPLKERKNVVLTTDTSYAPEGVTIVRNTEDVLEMAKKEQVFVIGGAMVCQQFLPHTERLYITSIDEEFEGDIYFPKWNKNEWELESEITGKMDEKNIYRHCFLVYSKKNRTLR